MQILKIGLKREGDLTFNNQEKDKGYTSGIRMTTLKKIMPLSNEGFSKVNTVKINITHHCRH